jgi:predicted CopG family antitoxin
MVNTITIKDDVYKKPLARRVKERVLVTLFERLIDGNIHNNIEALKKIRGSIEFDQEIKDKILTDIALKRD